MSDDWQLSQGTVDARNEERRAANAGPGDPAPFVPGQQAEVVEATVEDDEQAEATPNAGMDLIQLPRTGEVIDPTDLKALVAALADVRLLESQLATAKRTLAAAIADHRRVQGTNTMIVPGGGKVEVTGGSKKTVDAEALADGLRTAGMPEDRVDAIVKPTVTYKVDLRKAQQAGKTNPAYQAALDAATKEEEAAWSVTLK